MSRRVEDASSRRQASSRVVIGADEAMEKIVAEQSGVLPCAGVTFDISLRPRITYYARVEVTGEDGEQAMSEAVPFDAGKMDKPWRPPGSGRRRETAFIPSLKSPLR